MICFAGSKRNKVRQDPTVLPTTELMQVVS